MATSGLLRLAATDVTNPEPNAGLTTVNPYPTPYVDRYTPSAAWIAQGPSRCRALISRGGSSTRNVNGVLDFRCSAGAAVTYTVTLHSLVQAPGGTLHWSKLPLQVYNLTGNSTINILSNGAMLNPDTPIFIQLSAPSSGTIDIYFDNGYFALL